MSGYMPRLVSGIMLAVALLGCAQTAHMDIAVGSVVTPGNTQVPLPPGNWQKLAEQKTESTRNTSGGTDNTHHVEAYYGLAENDRIKSLVYVSTSADAPHGIGYVPNAFCMRDTSPERTYLHEVDGGMTNYSDCLKVEKSRGFRPPSEASTAIYKELFRAASNMGGLSQRSVRALFYEALDHRFLEYAIYFFPERDGVQGNRWNAGEEGPLEKAYVHEIVSWAKQFRPAVRNGTQNLLR